MNLRYTLLSVILLLLAFGFTILPEKNYSKDLTADEVLLAVLDDSRYLSTDEVASLLLNNDPSLQLIDVRKPEQFKEFSLPGAVNIPLDSLLTEEASLYLDQDKTNVLYSNGSIYASQAWLLSRRMGYKKTFIMRGGLNQWVETILQPTEPKPEDPASDFARYQFRKGASQYFGGGSADVGSSTSTTKKRSTIKRKKKKSVAGGC